MGRHLCPLRDLQREHDLVGPDRGNWILLGHHTPQ
jgi:hypothetical protein